MLLFGSVRDGVAAESLDDLLSLGATLGGHKDTLVSVEDSYAGSPWPFLGMVARRGMELEREVCLLR